MNAMAELTSGLNWYDLYRHVYAAGPDVQSNRTGMTLIDGQEKWYKKGRTMREYTPWVRHHGEASDLVSHDFLSEYVNNASMREALHIPSYVQGWDQCSGQIDYHVQQEASLWIYKVLKGSGIRMLFYSGDTDGAVPLA